MHIIESRNADGQWVEKFRVERLCGLGMNLPLGVYCVRLNSRTMYFALGFAPVMSHDSMCTEYYRRTIKVAYGDIAENSGARSR